MALMWLILLLGQGSASCRSQDCSHFLYCAEGTLPRGCPESWVNGIAAGADSEPVSPSFLQCQEVNCLCSYVPLNSTCQAVGSSGITVGKGVDLQFFASKQELISMGITVALAEKLAPLLGSSQGDPIELAEKQKLVLTSSEADQMNSAVINKRTETIATLYNNETKGEKFMDLPKGIRTALHSFYYQNGGTYERNPAYWDAAFNQKWLDLMIFLNTAVAFQERRRAEAQLVAAALRECTQNDLSDVVLVLDGSGSISKADFAKGKDFLVSLVQNFTIAQDKTRVSFLVFSSQTTIACYLNTYNSTSDITQEIRSAMQPSGGTGTGGALQTVITEILTSENGRRTGNASCLTVVLTDGMSGDGDVLAIQAPLLKNICSVMAIGIGSGVNELELELIASQNNFVSTISDFQVLIDGIQAMKKSICLVPEYVTIDTPSLVRAPENVYRYFAIRLTSRGATVHIILIEGDFVLYGSWSDPNPTEYSYDFIVESAEVNVMRFKIPKNATISANYTQAFISTVGKDSNNEGTLKLMEGLFCSDLQPYTEGKECPGEGGSEGRMLGLAVLMVFLCSN